MLVVRNDCSKDGFCVCNYISTVCELNRWRTMTIDFL